MSAILKFFQENSHLYGGNATFVEDLYERYLEDPNAVPAGWRTHFDQMQQAGQSRDLPHGPVRRAFEKLDTRGRAAVRTLPTAARLSAGAAEKQAAVLRLINAYRFRGHQHAAIDPISLRELADVPELNPEFHHLAESDMDTEFNTGSLYAPERMTLREVLRMLRDTYCGTLAAEYMYLNSTHEKRWIQQRIEGSRGQYGIAAEARQRCLERISAAEGLERYLHSKYVGQKRFSLEGGESLIPLLDELIQRSGEQGIREMAIGMAHRGRLNVLINIVGKSPRQLFEEFEGKYDMKLKSGDVKYHSGFSSDVETAGGNVHLALAFNPSHLEIVSPVVEGSVRARQQRRGDRGGKQVLPVAIHGDAAFAGQGVVMETLNMSTTRGFKTGGTVHVIVNNQIGFTTSHPLDARSTLYCTDIAKMVEAPIFHVNGDDPDAVLFAVRTALDFRMEFGKDVVIDLVCYRRHGHNEADEPSATQPVMYRKIKSHPTTRQIYAQRLVQDGVIEANEPDRLVEEYRNALDDGRIVACNILENAKHEFLVDWSPYFGAKWTDPFDTAIPMATVKELGTAITTVPPGFELHPRVERILRDREKMAAGALAMDWGFAETMAYASLLKDGHPVRISGQDCGRGTFFHRHAVLHHQQDGSTYVPLQHISPDQPHFLIIDSVLSEEAVLAFEYGYSTADPTSLVIWEAQFGDFANGAQMVIDQFISSGETKWGRLCGLTMLLPHGFEGQGPEHSSARLERFLQLCGEINMQVCVPSTPAQIFHLLRRQVRRPFRKPLVIMSPKSLLRHKLAVSSLDCLSNGEFQNVIDEVDDINEGKVRQIVLCAGKVYYDLLEERRARGIEDVAIIRIEQLYPFPRAQLEELLAQYPAAKRIVWCQEEPQNQGVWYQSRHHLRACKKPTQSLAYAGRAVSASPAVGSFSLHVKQQQALIDEALTVSNNGQ